MRRRRVEWPCSGGRAGATIEAVIETLELSECEALLRASVVGRVGVVHGGVPLVIPVGYHVTTLDGRPVVAIRTRTGNVMDHVGSRVSFEIDGVRPDGNSGWSVLVVGGLADEQPDDGEGARPIVDSGHDMWRLIIPERMTGRRLVAAPSAWAFHPGSYL